MWGKFEDKISFEGKSLKFKKIIIQQVLSCRGWSFVDISELFFKVFIHRQTAKYATIQQTFMFVSIESLDVSCDLVVEFLEDPSVQLSARKSVSRFSMQQR